MALTFVSSDSGPAPVMASVTPSRIASTVAPDSTSVLARSELRSAWPSRSTTSSPRSTLIVPVDRSTKTVPSLFESGSASSSARTVSSRGAVSIESSFSVASTPGNTSMADTTPPTSEPIWPPGPSAVCSGSSTAPSTASTSPTSPSTRLLCNWRSRPVSMYSDCVAFCSFDAYEPTAPMLIDAWSSSAFETSAESSCVSSMLRSRFAVSYSPLL